MSKLTYKSVREGFGEALLAAAQADSRIIALTADLRESLRLQEFAKLLPQQFVEVGVSEQNLMGVAAGLALSGKIPFATSFAAFNPGRNWDQLRVSVAYTKANVKVVGSHAGIGVGPDGATHQMLEDVALVRVLPNMTVLVPTDAAEVKLVVAAAIKLDGPVYIRFGREALPIISTDQQKFEIGKAIRYHTGSSVTICANGPLVYEALQAARQLKKEGISCDLFAVPTVKPLDEQAILHSAKKTGAVLIAEDGQRAGGLGGTVAELLGGHYPVPLELLGIDDQFGQSGSADQLMDHYGLRAKQIISLVQRLIKRKITL